jgi:hypothetical protein
MTILAFMLVVMYPLSLFIGILGIADLRCCLSLSSSAAGHCAMPDDEGFLGLLKTM